jgi:ribosomal protein S6--L-glutamate ligase
LLFFYLGEEPMFQINRGALPPSSQRNGAKIVVFSSRKLKPFFNAGNKLGHEMIHFNPKGLTENKAASEIEKLLNKNPEVIIPRGVKGAFSILDFLEFFNLPSVNPSKAIQTARDQLETLKVLDMNGLPIPKTGFITTGAETLGDKLVGVEKPSDALDHVGGFPCVVKCLHGSHGNGVHLVKNQKELVTLTEKLEKQGKPYLIQEFIAGAGGEDLRYFVVGDRVVTAMRRKAKEDDFRANLGQGGSGYKHPIDSAEEALALRASKVIGLGIAGVDLIPTGNGTVSILEVNSSPGRQIENITGIDVVTPIIEEAVRLAKEAKAPKVVTPQRQFSLIS